MRLRDGSWWFRGGFVVVRGGSSWFVMFCHGS